MYMKKGNMNTTYKTSDIGLAATLALSFPVEGINKTNPKRAIFLFVESPNLKTVVEHYYLAKTGVEPMAFLNKIKTLKTMINS